MNDNDILRLIREAPPRGQRALFDEYYNYVCAVVVRVLHGYGSREDMDECVMDVFTNVFLRLDEARVTGLKGFIGTIASRTAIQMYRRLVRSSDTVYIEDETTEIADSQRIEHITERSDMRNTLLRLIESLGEPDSDIIIQKYYYNMNSNEIASKHSMSPEAVRMRCSRALKKLKELLTREGYDMKEGNV